MEKDLSKALNIAWRIIGIRPRSVFEIRRKLRERRFDKEIIEKVIDELKKLDLLDDEKFARAWLEERLRNRPCGRFLIKKKLLEKGISEEIVNSVLEENLSRELEIELARKLMESKDKEPRQKLVLFLKSRGFGWEVIEEVIY